MRKENVLNRKKLQMIRRIKRVAHINDATGKTGISPEDARNNIVFCLTVEIPRRCDAINALSNKLKNAAATAANAIAKMSDMKLKHSQNKFKDSYAAACGIINLGEDALSDLQECYEELKCMKF